MVGNPAVPAIQDKNTKCPRPRASAAPIPFDPPVTNTRAPTNSTLATVVPPPSRLPSPPATTGMVELRPGSGA